MTATSSPAGLSPGGEAGVGRAVLLAATVVTGAEVLRPGWVDIADDRIIGVGSGRPPSRREEGDGAGQVVDLGAVTLVPGFVDMHSHGGGGAAFTEATADAVATATALHRAHGTTRMTASLVSAHPEELLRQVTELAAHVHAGDLMGIHLEGPWMSPGRLGAHDAATLRPPDLGEIDRVLDAAQGAIRMVTLAPELPGGLEATRRFVEAGVVVAVGHTDATYAQTRAALDAGATVATHLFNAMRPVNHREPGPVVALLEDPRVTVELIADGVHLHPAAYSLACARAGEGRVAVVTDAMSAAGMSDGRYMLGSLEVDVVDGTARVAGTGTIAGSTATMDVLFRFALAHAGHVGDAALLQAVRQTSTTPARVMGVEAGSLAPGVRADLVALDAEMSVRRVMSGGAWVTPA